MRSRLACSGWVCRASSGATVLFPTPIQPTDLSGYREEVIREELTVSLLSREIAAS